MLYSVINGYKFINLTPHAINLVLYDVVIEIPPSGVIARVEFNDTLTLAIGNLKFYSKEYVKVIDLPEPELGVYYIVSNVVKEVVNRNDLIVPNDLVRNESGVVIGCKSFRI